MTELNKLEENTDQENSPQNAFFQNSENFQEIPATKKNQINSADAKTPKKQFIHVFTSFERYSKKARVIHKFQQHKKFQYCTKFSKDFIRPMTPHNTTQYLSSLKSEILKNDNIKKDDNEFPVKNASMIGIFFYDLLTK